MKIDFLINKMEAGGAERVVSILANYLTEKQHEVRIITFQGTDSYELHPNVKRVRLHKHPFFRSVVFNGFFSLLHFYRKKANRPDIMSSHIHFLGYMTIPISKLYGINLIVSEHSNHIAGNTFAHKILWNVLYRLPDAVTILTRFDLEFFSTKNKRVIVMPNPCPFEVIVAKNALNHRRKEILAIGNLDRYQIKGFDNLIPIAAKVLKQNPDWRLQIIGGGESGTVILKKMIAEYDMSGQIFLLGLQNNIKERLSKTEIFILPSRYEGLPMALLEAMSQGAGCIAYNCVSGPSDIIIDKENGLLIENQNSDEMASKLHELMNNTELRDKFHEQAPKSMERFSISVIGAKWESLIKEILSS